MKKLIITPLVTLIAILVLTTSRPVESQVSSNTAYRIRYGTSTPATCNPATGDVFFKTSATITVYYCSATNTWSAIGSGGTITGSGSAGQVAYYSGASAITGDASFTFAPSTLTSTQGSLTGSSTPFLSHTATWNNSGTTFENLVSNVTNTASNAASTLIDLKVANTSQFKVTRGGAVTATGVLTSAGVSLSAGSVQNTNSGLFYWNGRSTLTSAADGVLSATINSNGKGIRFQFLTEPAVASGFGSSPGVTSGSTDTAGSINVGTGGAATSGIINFAATWASAPFCLAQDITTSGKETRPTTSTTQLTLTTGSAWTASDVVVWHCIGSK